MFQHFTVLFIGYSHDDPLMRYLALGLPSRTPRFALTSDQTAADLKWKRLGVEPIPYPTIGNDHSALEDALRSWDRLARMGALDHATRVEQIVSGGPQMTPVDRDYMLERISTPLGVREMIDALQGRRPDEVVSWLVWLEQVQDFSDLFTAATASETGRHLASWFSQTIVGDPLLQSAGLHTIRSLGLRLESGLFDELCWAAHALRAADPLASNRWLALLSSSVVGRTAAVTSGLLLSADPSDTPLNRMSVEASLRPSLRMRPRWFGDDGSGVPAAPDVDLEWPADTFSLAAQLNQAASLEQQERSAFGSILEACLLRAYFLMEGFRGSLEFDPLSFSRSAISDHPQNLRSDGLDAVIDALRAYGEHAVQEDRGLRDRWWSLGYELFQRLSIHLVAFDPAHSADARVQWLLDKRSLFDNRLKHEVFSVLDAEVRSTSPALRASLLTAVLEGPPVPDSLTDSAARRRSREYSVYNLLVWLTTAAPEWEQAQSALDEITSRHKDFAPREHPEFNSWMSETEWVSDESVADWQSLLVDFDRSPDDAATRLAEVAASERQLRDSPDQARRSLERLIGRACSERPDYGLALWRNDEFPEQVFLSAAEVKAAIIEGWARSEDPSATSDTIQEVLSVVDSAHLAAPIADYLLSQVRLRVDEADSSETSALRRIAVSLWKSHSAGFEHRHGDPLGSVPLFLNAWPGALAQYWLTEIDRRWRQLKDEWVGLDDEERKWIGQLVDTSGPTREATVPAFTSTLYFVHAADRAFTVQHLLPLFVEDATSPLGWIPFLLAPRFNDAMLRDGLLQALERQWARLEQFSDDHARQRFFDVTSAVIAMADVSEEERRRLLDLPVVSGDESSAQGFAQAMVAWLARADVDGPTVWRDWLKGHVRRRFNNLPRKCSDAERARWADVVPLLGEAIPGALSEMAFSGAGLHDDFNDTLPSFALEHYGPELASHFAGRVRSSHAADRLHHYRIRSFIERFAASTNDDIAAPLLRAGREAGFVDS